MYPKLKILVMADWFSPAYKAGGPVRSVVNFATNMRAIYDIYVFTSDRDLGDKECMAGIRNDLWIDFIPGIKVFYASPSMISLYSIRKMILGIMPDYIYLNSMFSTSFTIYPLMLKRLGLIESNVVLSPRGMLKPSALQFKAAKKIVFLKLLKTMGFTKSIVFHATDETEESFIRKQFSSANIKCAPNFPGHLSDNSPPNIKIPGELALVFIGRIHPIKNLDYLLDILLKVSGNIQLTVVGVIEDIKYYNKCVTIVKELPAQIKVDFVGELPHTEIENILRSHHIFTLPTKGENFGHAIFESLAMGRPVLISDQTPWRNLINHNAGWDLPLSEPDKFAEVLNSLVSLDQEGYNSFVFKTREYLHNYLVSSNTMEAYSNIFINHEN